MNIKYILSGILFTFAFSSCEDVLSTKTTFELEDADVWHVPDLAKGVLHKAYQGIQTRPDCFDNNFLDCATDNAVTNVYSSGVYKLGLGGMTSMDNPIANWGNCYKMIEYINSFLENGLTDNTLYNRVDEEKDKKIKERLRGEALFLRAWWHFELLKMYGGKGTDGVALGIPYLDHFITQEEASNKGLFVRPTYAKTIDCIINDLDEAMDLLPSDYTSSEEEFNNQQMGRANKLAAAVLKSRVLVYSASPAYQDDEIVKITGMGQYEVLNPDYYKSKWSVVAMEINKILSMQGFEDFTILNKTMIADAGTTPSDDFVFYKYFNTNALEKQQFPPFYYGNANTNPSHNLVMAFCSKENGFPAYDSRSDIDYNAEGFNMIDDLYSKNDFIEDSSVFGRFIALKEDRASFVHRLDLAAIKYAIWWIKQHPDTCYEGLRERLIAYSGVREMDEYVFSNFKRLAVYFKALKLVTGIRKSIESSQTRFVDEDKMAAMQDVLKLCRNFEVELQKSFSFLSILIDYYNHADYFTPEEWEQAFLTIEECLSDAPNRDKLVGARAFWQNHLEFYVIVSAIEAQESCRKLIHQIDLSL